MGAKRKPTAIKELNGSAAHDPQRLNKNEPTPKAGIGPAPDHLSDFEKACWDEFVGLMFPGVMGDSDRLAVERAVKLLASSRLEPDSFTAAQETAFYRYLAAFGMTPADRSKIHAPKGEKKNPFEAL